MNGHFWLWKFLAAPMSFWTVNRVRIWPTWGGPTKKRHVFHVLASVRLRSYKNSTMLFLAPFKARRVSLSHPFAFSIPFWIVKGKIFFFSFYSFFRSEVFLLFFYRCVLQIFCCMMLHLLSCVLLPPLIFYFSILYSWVVFYFWCFDVLLFDVISFFFCVWAIVAFFIKLKRCQICVGLFSFDLISNGFDL